MKKLALIPLVILVLGVFALPAYATHYAPLSVSCTLASGGWTAFEGTGDEILSIHVTQPGSPAADATVHTNGAASGSFSVPLSLSGNGLITMTVTTPLIPDPGIATATANCEPETTTTTTTTTSTTTSTTTTTTRPPVTTTSPPVQVLGAAVVRQQPVQVLGAAVVRVSPNFAG